MVTYLACTDGMEASEAIGEILETELAEADRVRVITISDEPDEELQRAVDGLAETVSTAGASVESGVLGTSGGGGPVYEALSEANRIDADMIFVGLRRRSRTKRYLSGTFSYDLLDRTSRPVTLVPLADVTSEIDPSS